VATDLRGRVWDGEYALREMLAQGGMAAVYKAHAQSLDTTVAVKVLAPDLARDPEFRERFQAEARTIEQNAFHHPNMITVHRFGQADGFAYIVMRFAPGGTLKQRLADQGGRMDLRTAGRVIAQIAAALQHAHDQGRVHLDVKPANILLGNADWPLLSDFGIMAVIGDPGHGPDRVAGTPAYMSPEQWQGAALDGRSDQYSLALVFYEMVTGRPPFLGETSAELQGSHIHEPPPRPRELNPGIPGPVEEVLLRALAKQPEDRFPTIGGFAEALVEAIERARGMQLETKEAIVSLAPNLVAFVVLSALAPLLAGLPSREPVFGSLTLDWPIKLVVALLQVGLLLAMRWQVVGLVSRLVGTLLDGLDRFTRTGVRLGTDPEGPLRVQAWRNAAIGSVETIVNVAFLFAAYRLAGPPLIKTVALLVDPRLEPTIATAGTGLLLVVVLGLVFKIYRASGAVVAVCVLAICWALLSSLPLADTIVLGRVSLQWLAKLVIGLAVLAACLGVRSRVQRGVAEYVVPLLEEQMLAFQIGKTGDRSADRRQRVARLVPDLVDVGYVLLGFAILALPGQRVLAGLTNETVAAIVVSLLAVAAAAVQIGQLWRLGAIAGALGLLLCTPMLLSLPLLDVSVSGLSLRWVGRLLISLGVLLLALGVRRRVQAATRQLVVPIVDRNLGHLIASSSEEQEETRRRILEDSAGGLVDLAYLAVAYVALIGPLASVLGQADGFGWAAGLLYAGTVGLAGYLAYRVARQILPAIRPVHASEPDEPDEPDEPAAVAAPAS
jgi:tRNA A-37 threonylcarbamoyl transferase component Bud32